MAHLRKVITLEERGAAPVVISRTFPPRIICKKEVKQRTLSSFKQQRIKVRNPRTFEMTFDPQITGRATMGMRLKITSQRGTKIKNKFKKMIMGHGDGSRGWVTWMGHVDGSRGWVLSVILSCAKLTT